MKWNLLVVALSLAIVGCASDQQKPYTSPTNKTTSINQDKYVPYCKISHRRCTLAQPQIEGSDCYCINADTLQRDQGIAVKW